MSVHHHHGIYHPALRLPRLPYISPKETVNILRAEKSSHLVYLTVSGPQQMLNKCLKEKGKGGVQVDTQLYSLGCNQAQCAGSFFTQPSSTLRYRMEEKAKVKEAVWSLNTVASTFISLTEAPASHPSLPTVPPKTHIGS